MGLDTTGDVTDDKEVIKKGPSKRETKRTNKISALTTELEALKNAGKDLKGMDKEENQQQQANIQKQLAAKTKRDTRLLEKKKDKEIKKAEKKQGTWSLKGTVSKKERQKELNQQKRNKLARLEEKEKTATTRTRRGD